MRISKTFSHTNGTVYAVTNYTYSGTKLVHMTKNSDALHFFYDNQGRPAKVSYNGAMYTYLHNLQGDIVGIIDGNGTLVVEYKYNAWGTILSKTGSMVDTLGYLNPFRYRGYIFDEETWMYWLENRYYYPELYRFISMDPIMQPSSLYAYCVSNPIMYTDATGLDHHNLEVSGGDPKRDFAERHITKKLGVNDIYSYKFTYSSKKTISSSESDFSRNISILASGVCKLANSIAFSRVPVPKKLKGLLSKFKRISKVEQEVTNFTISTAAQMFVQDPFESLWTKTAGSYESYHFSREKYSGIHFSTTTYELRVYDYSGASFEPSIDYEIWMSRLSRYSCIPESCIAKWSDPVVN